MPYLLPYPYHAHRTAAPAVAPLLLVRPYVRRAAAVAPAVAPILLTRPYIRHSSPVAPAVIAPILLVRPYVRHAAAVAPPAVTPLLLSRPYFRRGTAPIAPAVIRPLLLVRPYFRRTAVVAPPVVTPYYLLPYPYALRSAAMPVVVLPVDLLAALKIFVDADADLTTALPGGYWLGLAPAATSSTPYATTTELNKVLFLQTGRRGGWAAERYQLSVFANTPTEARVTGNLLRSKLDYLVLEFEGGVMSDGLIPEGSPGLLRDPMRGRGNRPLWQEYSTYRAHVNRPGR